MISDTDREARSGSIALTQPIGPWRLAIGLVQGITAWLLLRLVVPGSDRFTNHAHGLYWSARHPMLFAALALITASLPVIALAEMARMRRRTLLLYLGVTAAVLAGLSAYDVWRDPVEIFGVNQAVRVWPSFGACFGTAMVLFIVNQLLEHHERGYSLFANYAEHFEDSWMRGFQLIVSLIFSLLVWGVLNLGAALFDLIHITWVQTTIDHNWFRCPALAVAFAAAIHVTDVRPALIKGMRNIALTLLSWLLPLVVVLGIGFLCGLLFVGLKPLWATRRAASILLFACALTFFLLNAAYKDGDRAALPPGVLRWAGRASGPTTLLLTLLACYALLLRVQQYGWTPERVVSSAAALIALAYSGGYTRAAISRTSWLKPLEAVNVGVSLGIIAVLLLLLTPPGDPARLSVESQVSRLAHGAVSASRFDYQFLRFDGGAYGRRALARLAQSQDADVRARALRMQAMKARRYFSPGAQNAAATEPAFSHATIYPKGAQLPQDFLRADWSSDAGGPFDCLQNGGTCEIYLIPYGAEGDMAVLVRPVSASSAPRVSLFPAGTRARLYQRDGSGRWENTGEFDHLACPGVIDALRTGNLHAVQPAHDDLLVNGVRLVFSTARPGDDACQARAPVQSQAAGRARDATAPAQMGPAFGSPGGH